MHRRKKTQSVLYTDFTLPLKRSNIGITQCTVDAMILAAGMKGQLKFD